MKKEDSAPANVGGPVATHSAELAKLESQAEAQRAADHAADAEETVLQRRKLGRGSSRRIVRAKDAFDVAVEDFCKLMDSEVFAVDDNGARNGPWPVLAEIRAFKVKVLAATSEILA